MGRRGRFTKPQRDVDAVKIVCTGAFALAGFAPLLARVLGESTVPPFMFAFAAIGAFFLPAKWYDVRWAGAAGAAFAVAAIAATLAFGPLFDRGALEADPDLRRWANTLVATAAIMEAMGAAALIGAFREPLPRVFFGVAAGLLIVGFVLGAAFQSNLAWQARAFGTLMLSASLVLAAFDVLARSLGARGVAAAARGRR